MTGSALALHLDNEFAIIQPVDAATLLREARIAAGLSQRELAARAGIPQPAIARIESGASSPRVDTLARLLAACDRQVAHVRRSSAIDPQDWAQVQDNLRRTPTERLRNLEAAARAVAELRRAAHRAGMRSQP